MNYTSQSDNSAARELISFRVGDQEFCVDIMSVREIRGWSPATPLPGSARSVLGVINLRGAILPIIDLSTSVGRDPVVPNGRHVIIVVEVGKKLVGLLVDAVSDILTVTHEMIQPTPDMAESAGDTFTRGILAIEGRMICLIDPAALLPNMGQVAA
jgi:purine-binding chemotaxis protein CheW